MGSSPSWCWTRACRPMNPLVSFPIWPRRPLADRAPLEVRARATGTTPPLAMPFRAHAGLAMCKCRLKDPGGVVDCPRKDTSLQPGRRPGLGGVRCLAARDGDGRTKRARSPPAGLQRDHLGHQAVRPPFRLSDGVRPPPRPTSEVCRHGPWLPPAPGPGALAPCSSTSPAAPMVPWGEPWAAQDPPGWRRIARRCKRSSSA